MSLSTDLTKLVKDDETPGESVDFLDNAMQTDNGPGLKRRTTLTLSNTKIIPEDDISRVWNKFLEDTEFSYDEAISKHVSVVYLTVYELIK